MQRKPRPEVTGPKSTDPNRKGDFWEKEVARECALRGYESYTNDYSTGEVDLFIRIDKEYHPFDVKVDKWNYDQGIWRASNVQNIPHGVWGICVNPETGKPRWPNYQGTQRPKCPPGWEEIWD